MRRRSIMRGGGCERGLRCCGVGGAFAVDLFRAGALACAKKRCLNVGEEVLARVVVNFRKSSDVIG